MPWREKKLLGVFSVSGFGNDGGIFFFHAREVGGVLVDILGQEVLHGGRVEHDGAGSVGVQTSQEGLLDAAGVGGWRRSGVLDVEDLDAGNGRLFLLDLGC